MGAVVTLKYDPVWEPLEWAKANCKSYITNDVNSKSTYKHINNTHIDYYFADERDAVLFKLRWSDRLER